MNENQILLIQKCFVFYELVYNVFNEKWERSETDKKASDAWALMWWLPYAILFTHQIHRLFIEDIPNWICLWSWYNNSTASWARAW